MQSQNISETPQTNDSFVPQTYSVTIHPITKIEQRAALQEAIDRISATDATLSYFYDSILHGYKEATHLLQKLQKAQVIGEEQGREHTDRSVSTYLALLTEIKFEMDREKTILQELMATQETKTIEVFEQTPESFDVFVSQKIKSAKTQTKKIESSLRVSFSRYEHWIKETIARMQHIQNELGIR
jgi:hypothetical protein